MRLLTRNACFLPLLAINSRCNGIQQLLALHGHRPTNPSGTWRAKRGLGIPVPSTDQEKKEMRTIFRASLVVLAIALAMSVSAFAADATADVFKSKCASCHGADGKGDTPAGKKMNVKDLASDDVQKQSDA